MKKTLALAAAGLLAAGVPALAQTRTQTQPPTRPATPPTGSMTQGQDAARTGAMRPTTASPTPQSNRNRAPDAMTGPRPYMSEPGIRTPGAMAGSSSGMDYGRWDAGWGPRPPAPPSGFANPSDWHRHVRACQQRYKSYDPSTDRFVPRAGQTARCTR